LSAVASEARRLILALVGLDAAAAVNVETGMFPALEHAGAFGLQETLLAKEGDELGAEQLLHCVHAVLRQDQEALMVLLNRGISMSVLRECIGVSSENS